MALIEFENKTLGSIVRTVNGLVVPVNQRAYAWDKEHVTDFLQDVTAAMKSSAEYFVGSIIVIKQGNETEVYDGQQRLATTMILIAAIRDYVFRHGTRRAAETITSDFLEKFDADSEETEPRFRLSSEDRVFFENYVLHSPDDERRTTCRPDERKESHGKIKDAATLAAKHVASLIEPLPIQDGINLLGELRRYLDSSVRVIWVIVGDQPTAFKIFETMNDRGLKLSAADLVKNFFCSQAPDDTAAVIEKWKSMTGSLETLGNDDGDVVEFARYSYIVDFGHVRTGDLFVKVKAKVLSRSAAIEWVTKLAERSKRYVAILNASDQAWIDFDESVRQDIGTMRSVLSVSAYRPMMLAVHEKFSKKEQTQSWKLAVSWTVRFLICGIPSGTVEGYYNRNAKAISDGSITSTQELIKKMAEIVPDDDRFRAACATANVSNAALARYYLGSLENAANSSTEVQKVVNTDRSVVTLEHILPQSPQKDWDHISEDLQKTLRNRLGNLVLLTKKENGKIGNVGYDQKKHSLNVSEFVLTQNAGKFTSWDASSIDARQANLADLAVKTWPIKIH